MDLTDLYSEYLQAKGSGEVAAWDAYVDIVRRNQAMDHGHKRAADRLFVTDVMKCRRAIAYRILKSPKNPLTDAKRIMFQQAEDIATHTAAACLYAGVLEDYEYRVHITDRENWGGRGDILLPGAVIVDVKSTRSNSFRNDGNMPFEDHEAQCSVYYHYFDTEEVPILFYVDRGGSNPPRQEPVALFRKEQIDELMDECEHVRRTCQTTLPPVLQPRLYRKNMHKLVKPHNFGEFTSEWTGQIWYGPSYWCSDAYCDFHRCPNKKADADTMLLKMTKKDGLDWSSKGATMKEEVLEYLASDLREMSV